VPEITVPEITVPEIDVPAIDVPAISDVETCARVYASAALRFLKGDC
jgi:hypothetical protein